VLTENRKKPLLLEMVAAQGLIARGLFFSAGAIDSYLVFVLQTLKKSVNSAVKSEPSGLGT